MIGRLGYGELKITTSAGETLTKDEDPVDAIESEDVDQETVKVRKKD